MTNFQDLAQSWDALQSIAPDLLIPITDNETLARATTAVRALSKEIGAKTSGPHPLDSLVELVSGRIVAYEAIHFPIPDADGPMMLAFYMDQKKLTQQQVSEATGIKQTTISSLLNHKRPFTADHARKLGQFFGVNSGMFL